MKIFSKRNFLIGLVTFALGLLAVASIWGLPGFLRREATVTGKVTAYLLDKGGAVNGLLLEGGDQLRFSPQTGEAVAARIKVGDEVSATGHAGTKSQYGREVRVRQISANGQAIVEMEPAPPPPRHGKPGPEDRGQGPRPPKPQQPDAATTQPSPPPAAQGNEGAEAREAQRPDVATGEQQAPLQQPGPPPAPETFKASGNISAHLVNGHGDVDGLILSSGEQVNFSPKVGELVTAAEQGGATSASVEGTGARSEHGTVIRPRTITVGNQTFTVGRSRD